MLQLKCKKSVFCVLFLFCFFLGTICGMLLFHGLLGVHDAWITAYCRTLAQLERPNALTFLFFCGRPLLLAFVLGLCPKGWRLVPLLVLARGCLMAYIMSFYAASALPPTSLVLRWLVLLPVFYYMCRWAYFAEGLSAYGSRSRRCAA